MSKRAAAAPLAHWPAPAGLALAVAGSALFFSRDFSLAFTFPKFLVLGGGVWLAAAGLALEGRPLTRTSLDAPLAACALVLALSAYFSTDVWLSLLGVDHGGLWGTALLIALYWLTAQTASGREERLLDAALLAYGLVGLYAVLQAAGFGLLKGMPPLPSGRAYATVGSPVALGEGMTLFLPLALYRLHSGKGGAAAWACFAAITCGLLASVSRGAWLSSAAACGVLLALEKDRFGFLKNRRRLALAGVAALILACAAGWALARRPMEARDGGRTSMWRSAWELFKERPLLGWGPNTFSAASRLKLSPGAVLAFSVKEVPHHAHNDLLHALATTGLLGLCAYLWLWIALARCALGAIRDPDRPWARAAACGLLGLFLNLKVNPASLEALAAAAFFAGLLAGRCPVAGPARRGAALAALVFATASLLATGRFAAADVAKRSAERFSARRVFDLAVSEGSRAVRLNPWEIRYRLDYVNALAGLSARLAPPSSRNAELLETALAAAREGVRLHPRHPDAHYGEGIALLNLAYLDLSLRGRLGDLEPARLALDRALSLDAHYIPTLQARRVVAEGQRDPASAVEMTRRISEMKERERPLLESVQGVEPE